MDLIEIIDWPEGMEIQINVPVAMPAPSDEDRDATIREIEAALDAYKHGVLERTRGGKVTYVPFDGVQDAKQVQMALALRGLQARTTAIIEVAMRKGLC
jgi:hypothetical protein